MGNQNLKRKISKSLCLCGLIVFSAAQAVFATEELEYRIAWDYDLDEYQVFMRPLSTPDNDVSLTGQVTVKVPYENESNKFAVSDITSSVENIVWALASDVYGPDEAPDYAYLSFAMTYQDPSAFGWQAGQEIKVFSFKNQAACLGSVTLINNITDPFNKPNSKDTNPGNQFTNLGWGTSDDNNYKGNYGEEVPADCTLIHDDDDDGLKNNQEVDLGTDPANPDSDGDGISDSVEVGDPENPVNTDGDDKINALDEDDDNDGVLTVAENYNGGTPEDDDTDGDNQPDYLDIDDDGDNKLSADEGNDLNADGLPEDARDSDGDEIPNYLDADDSDGPLADPDNDGLTNAQEETLGTDPANPDSDGDGISDSVEVGDPENPVNTDGDDRINALDEDDDNDGVLTVAENYNDGTPEEEDTDNDSIPDYLDPDDDGDGIPSAAEGNDPDGNHLPDDADDTDNDSIPDYLDAEKAIRINVRALLQGAYQSSKGLMRDDLRIMGLIPAEQPYTDLNLHQGAEQAASALLDQEGEDAIVDWLLVELRNADNPSQVVASQAVLLQRDGDVVSSDRGDLNLLFDLAAGDYYVAVRHRNHLGVMTTSALALSYDPVMVDFSATATPVYGQFARLTDGPVALLYAGDATTDKKLISDGPSNERVLMLSRVLTEPGNTSLSLNYLVQGYNVTDITLDGITIYDGPNNDVNVLAGNILTYPTNETFNANYVVQEQIPQ